MISIAQSNDNYNSERQKLPYLLSVFYGADVPIFLLNNGNGVIPNYDKKAGVRADALRACSMRDIDTVHCLGNLKCWNEDEFCTWEEIARAATFETMEKLGFGLSVGCGVIPVACLDVDLPDSLKKAELWQKREYLSAAVSTIENELKSRGIGYVYDPSVNGAHFFVKYNGSEKSIMEGNGRLFGVQNVGFFHHGAKQMATIVGKDMSQAWSDKAPYMVDGGDFGDLMERVNEKATSSAQNRATGESTTRKVNEYGLSEEPIFGDRNNTVFKEAPKALIKMASLEEAYSYFEKRIKQGCGFDNSYTPEQLWSDLKRVEETSSAVNAARQKQARKAERDKYDEEYEQWSTIMEHDEQKLNLYKIGVGNCVQFETGKKNEIYNPTTREIMSTVEFDGMFWANLAKHTGYSPISQRTKKTLYNKNGISSAEARCLIPAVQPCYLQEVAPHTIQNDGSIITINTQTKELVICKSEDEWRQYLQSIGKEYRPSQYRAKAPFQLNAELYRRAEKALLDGREAYTLLEQYAPLHYSIIHHNLSAIGRQCLLENMGLVIVPILNNNSFASGLCLLGHSAKNGKSTITLNSMLAIGEGTPFNLNNSNFIDQNLFKATNSVICNDSQNAKQVANESIMLALPCGELIQGEIKHGSTVSTGAKRLLVFVANREINLQSKGNQFLRRLKQVNFNDAPEELKDQFKNYTPTLREINDYFTVALAYLMQAVRNGGLVQCNEFYSDENDCSGWLDVAVMQVLNNLPNYIHHDIRGLYNELLAENIANGAWTLGEEYHITVRGDKFEPDQYELTKKAKSMIKSKLASRGIESKLRRTDNGRIYCWEFTSKTAENLQQAYNAQLAQQETQQKQNDSSTAVMEVAESCRRQNEANIASEPQPPKDVNDFGAMTAYMGELFSSEEQIPF